MMGLETTFREKLEWLEEAETLALSFRASRERSARVAEDPPLPPASANPEG